MDRVGSRFTVVVAAAKRAKQLKDGAPPLVNLPTRNPLTVALHEIAAGLIQISDEPVITEEPEETVEEVGELAAPDIVEALIGRASRERDVAETAAEDYDSDLDEEIADDLDDEEEIDDDEEDEDELEEEDVEEDEDWSEEAEEE